VVFQPRWTKSEEEVKQVAENTKKQFEDLGLKRIEYDFNKMKQDIFRAIADPTRRAILALIAIHALTPNVMAGKDFMRW
jgi:fructose-bisphosphate aldolase class 1